MTKILGWHFIKNNRRLAFDAENVTVAPGYIYSYKGETPKLCVRGLHGSLRAFYALNYAKGEIICRIRLIDVVEKDKDKAVAWHREVNAMADATHELRLWACWCVRQAGDQLLDKHCYNAVKVAEHYAMGQATLKELNAARNAAENAIRGTGANHNRVTKTTEHNAYTAARLAALYVAQGPDWVVTRNAVINATREAAWAITWNKMSNIQRTWEKNTAWYNALNTARHNQDEELERRMLALIEK